jgi:hypothetical protein
MPTERTGIASGALFLLIGLLFSHWVLQGQTTSEPYAHWSLVGLSETPPALKRQSDALSYGAVPNDGLDDALAIQAALDDLQGLPGMVFLPPGVYRIEHPIDLPAGSILRGAGADSTRLLVDFGGNNDDALRIWSPVEGGASVLPGHPALGDQSVALSPSEPLSDVAVGDWVELWQDNGTWDTNPAAWAAESTGHLAQVAARDSSSLQFRAPIPSRFDTAMALMIRRIEPIRFVGVECLSMERIDDASAGSLIQCFLAANCWMRGLVLHRSVSAHILAARSAHLEVRGCYVHEAWAYDGASTRGYGVALVRHTVYSLIEDNVFRRLRHAMIVKQGAAGNVFAYNYSLEPNRSELISDFSGDISLHGHWPQHNLFEGNDVANIITDDYWGPSGPGNALFRNRARLYGVLNTSSGTLEQFYAGNVLTGVGTLLGQYLIFGSGHTEFGNWVNGSLVPSGSGVTGPQSLYQSAAPEWWDGPDPWPALGFGQQGMLPARARYDAGSPQSCRQSACRSVDTLYALPAGPGVVAFAWDAVPDALGYVWRARPSGGSWIQGRTLDTIWQRSPPVGNYQFQIRPECAGRLGAPSPPASAEVEALRTEASEGKSRGSMQQPIEASREHWILLDAQGRVWDAGSNTTAPPPRSQWQHHGGPSLWLWQNGRLKAW